MNLLLGGRLSMIQCTKGTMVDADGIRMMLFSFWWNRDCRVVDACSHSSLLTNLPAFMLAWNCLQ